MEQMTQSLDYTAVRLSVSFNPPARSPTSITLVLICESYTLLWEDGNYDFLQFPSGLQSASRRLSQDWGEYTHAATPLLCVCVFYSHVVAQLGSDILEF